MEFAPGLRPGVGLQREPLEFEPALGLWLLKELRPLELMRLTGLEMRQLRLLVELQKQLQLVLELEPQLVELLKQGQERRLELMAFDPALGLGLELRPLELMRLPGLEVLLLRLVIELRKQLEMKLLPELQIVERLRQG